MTFRVTTFPTLPLMLVPFDVLRITIPLGARNAVPDLGGAPETVAV